MPFSDQLRHAAADVWEAQLEHPFVRGIGDGTLDPERFRFYVRQDYLFLIEYGRLLALACARAPRLELMERFAELAQSILRTEMELHRVFAAEWGISREELEEERPHAVTRGYTDFLLRTAALGDFGELVAALVPCMWLQRAGSAACAGSTPGGRAVRALDRDVLRGGVREPGSLVPRRLRRSRRRCQRGDQNADATGLPRQQPLRTRLLGASLALRALTPAILYAVGKASTRCRVSRHTWFGTAAGSDPGQRSGLHDTRTNSDSLNAALMHCWIPPDKEESRPSLSLLSNLDSPIADRAESAAHAGVAGAREEPDLAVEKDDQQQRSERARGLLFADREAEVAVRPAA